MLLCEVNFSNLIKVLIDYWLNFKKQVKTLIKMSSQPLKQNVFVSAIHVKGFYN